jgi:uncharacterized protein with PQ loop repeat
MKFGLKRLNTWLVPPLAIAGLQVLIYLLDFAGQLPNPMAIHWGITMQPDGFVSVSDFALTVLILQLALWLPSLAADIWPKSKIRIRNLVILVIGIVFWLVTAILCVSLFIQVGATDAAAVDFPWPISAVLLLSVPVLLAFLLSMPEVVVGKDVQIRLRGLNIMSFDPEEIVSASVGVVSAREFGGWGIRLTTRKIGFVPSKGPAVKLNLQDGTEVSIRSKDPKAIVGSIEDLIS